MTRHGSSSYRCAACALPATLPLMPGTPIAGADNTSDPRHHPASRPNTASGHHCGPDRLACRCSPHPPVRHPKTENPIAQRLWPAASCFGGYRTPAGARYPSQRWTFGSAPWLLNIGHWFITDLATADGRTQSVSTSLSGMLVPNTGPTLPCRLAALRGPYAEVRCPASGAGKVRRDTRERGRVLDAGPMASRTGIGLNRTESIAPCTQATTPPSAAPALQKSRCTRSFVSCAI